MCRIMLIAGIKKQHQPKIQELAREMTKMMVRTEKDGVGYAAITSNGKIYGEKWLDDTHAFKPKAKPDPGYKKVSAILGKDIKFETPPPGSEYAHKVYGALSKPNLENTVALMLHTRKATFGAKTIENVHPFFELNQPDQPDVAIIHNGSINNHDKLTKKYSTCDSEVILHEYINNAMWHNPWGIDVLSKTLKGEYAVGALGSIVDNGVVTPYLDIFKSNKELYAGYVKELDVVIFTTSDYNFNELMGTCKLTMSGLAKVEDGQMIRLNAITGERIDDLIKFELSDKYNTVHSSYNYNSHTNVRSPQLVSSGNGHKETIEKMKRKFADNHSDLFEGTYYELPKGLTDDEKRTLDELQADPKVNKIALRLVLKFAGK